jgi:hypothetical protein
VKLLFAVVDALQAGGIGHALIGAAAMAARGVSRATLDLDLLVVDARALRPDTWSGLSNPAIRVDVRPGDADDPLAGVVRFESAGERPVDLVVGRAGWQRRAVERAGAITLEGRPLRVARTVDLVLLKLYAGGPQDAWDVEQLLGLEGEPGIVAQVERELVELPPHAAELWKRIRGPLSAP